MPFVFRPYRRFPVQCAVTYSVGAFTGLGTVWNLSPAGDSLGIRHCGSGKYVH